MRIKKNFDKLVLKNNKFFFLTPVAIWCEFRSSKKKYIRITFEYAKMTKTSNPLYDDEDDAIYW